MFTGKKVTKLIVVCDEKTKEYGNYLIQLISANDDKEGNIIGTEDGTVDAVVWLEKDYKANVATLSSNAHVLFIGNNKVTKFETSNMDIKFNKYGMKYGWLGKRAMMCVDNKMLKKNEYDSFIQFSQKYVKKFEKVKLNFAKEMHPLAKWVGALAPIVYPVAIYGLISGGMAHKKIRDQQYKCLTMILYIDALKKFLEG